MSDDKPSEADHETAFALGVRCSRNIAKAIHEARKYERARFRALVVALDEVAAEEISTSTALPLLVARYEAKRVAYASVLRRLDEL